jgi:transposase
VDKADGKLSPDEAQRWHARYHRIVKNAQIECPPPTDKRRKGTRGKLTRSKSRNLLERLIKYEDDVLRFVSVPMVPFTNNQGEHDIRMTKVQHKISGCFRSMDGALISCRIRSYLSTCRKQGVSATDALNILFDGQMPSFMSNSAQLPELAE